MFQPSFRSAVPPNPQTDWCARIGGPWTGAVATGLILVAFLACNLPMASTYLLHHADERHYTDAGILMVQQQDYLTPRTPDGTPRLRKPILAYWLVAGSYHLFGISPLASRLPFLLAGAAALALAYRLTWRLTGNHATAVLATLILMTHPIFALSAIRSMPDILLCVSCLAAAYGTIRVAMLERPAARHYLLLYGGLGAAIASKGLPGAALLLPALLALVANPWRRVDPRHLWHGPAMLVGVAIGGGWFALQYALHGSRVFEVLWEDQVGYRMTGIWWQPLAMLPKGVLAMLLTLGPWIAPLVFMPRRVAVAWRQATEPQRIAIGLFCFWTVLLAALIALVSEYSIRYILPVVPLQAVLAALMLSRLPQPLRERWLRGALLLAALLAVGLWSLAMLVGYQLSAGAASAAALATLLAAVLLATAASLLRNRLEPAVGLAVVLCAAVPLQFLLLRNVALPGQCEQIVARLDQLGLADGVAVYYVGSPALASKVRVLSQGRVRLINLSEDAEPVAGERYLLLEAGVAEQADLREYQVLPIARGMRRVDVQTALRAAGAGRLRELLDDRPAETVFAVRHSEPVAVAVERGVTWR